MTGVAIDPEGNVYVTGYFRGTIDVKGPSALESQKDENQVSTDDIFVASYTANGDYRWSRRGGGASNDQATAIVYDPSGMVHVTGHFRGAANFGGSTLDSHFVTVFVASFETALGHHRASHSWPMEDGDFSFPQSIAVDSSGNIYITGLFRGRYVFGSNRLVSGNPFYDVFVASVSSDYESVGSVRWATSFRSDEVGSAHSIVVDNSGNSYLTGAFGGEVRVGDETFSAPATAAFTASLNSRGELRWWSQSMGQGVATGKGIAIDEEGGIYVGGHFQGAPSFGGDSLDLAEGADAFLASYDEHREADGRARAEHRWSWGRGGAEYDEIRAIAARSRGEVYSTGVFYGPVNFGGGELGMARPAAFVAVHDGENGSHLASLAIGGPEGSAEGLSIAVGEEIVCVGGSFSGTIELGGRPRIARADKDAFIACFEP